VLLGLIHGLAASGSSMHDDSSQVTALGPGGACGQGIDRTPTDARVWGGEIDQVSGVRKVRTNTNRARLERKVRYLLVCMARVVPALWRGHEDLHALGAYGDGQGQAAAG
jgi:hypothetical protein